MCAQSLAVFDISKHTENGVEVTPEINQVGGTILSVFVHSFTWFSVVHTLFRNVAPFKCLIKPRSKTAERLVMEAFTM